MEFWSCFRDRKGVKSSLQTMSIFEADKYCDPEYQYLDKYVHIMYRGFWTPAKYEKLIRDQDVPYYFNEMGPVDQEAIKRCILAVALVEDRVKLMWPTLHFDLPQTIIGDVGGIFGLSEVTHRRSYHALLENLKTDVQEAYNHPATKGRIEYLTKYLETDPKIIGKKRILKKIVLFTALVERVSLFTQFYILMSYARANRGLETISALQRSTATEELVHYSFGVEIINKIKEQHPQLWDEYLIELVEKNIVSSRKAEIDLIDWFFEKGTPEHLSKEEVLNFLNYNLDTVAKDLGLGIVFPYDEEMYQSKNKWFMEKISAPIEPDFFANAVGGYASEEVEESLDEIVF